MSTSVPTRSADRSIGDTARAVLRGVADRVRRQRPWVLDCVVAAGFLVLAVWVGHGLWPYPTGRELALNPEDQILIEWFLAVDVQVLLGDTGLVTDRLNTPDGVNLLANASSLTLGFLLAPVTLTLGAPVSFAVLTVGNLAATATGWYLLFARTFRTHRAVAAVGGVCCGFAPAMISHSNSHWHMTAQWLVPAIVWSVVRLARAAEADDLRRTVTSGLWLAGLVVVQYFLGAEVLYLTAVTFALVAIGYAITRGRWVRQVLPGFLAGTAVATGAALLLLLYPLQVMYAAPGSVTDGPFSPHYFSADLASWPAFSSLTVAGTAPPGHLTTGPEEYNTFLGWPLLLVAAGCAAWLLVTSRRDRPLVIGAGIAAVVMAVLSLGPDLVLNGTRPGIPLLYAPLVDAPVVDGALPQRYAMAVVPLFAVILVVALERARARPAWAWARPAVPAVVAVALVPLFPTPLPAADRPPVPAFISEGHWRECARPGQVLVPVPLPTPSEPEQMRWATATGAQIALPEGFFIGPYGGDGEATVGTWKTPTSVLLARVAETGEVPEIGPEHRAQAARDLAFWEAQCVALDPYQPYEAELRAVLEALLGPGERRADAWTWTADSWAALLPD